MMSAVGEAAFMSSGIQNFHGQDDSKLCAAAVTLPSDRVSAVRASRPGTTNVKVMSNGRRVATTIRGADSKSL